MLKITISFLRTENEDLKHNNYVQSEKCLSLGKEIDRITEKFKSQVEKQKKKISELETKSCDKKCKHSKIVVSNSEHLKTQNELSRLRSENKSLNQTVYSLSARIEELDQLRPHLQRSKIMGNAKDEMKLMCELYVMNCEYEDENVLCKKCGTDKVHPWEECPRKKDLMCKKCGTTKYHPWEECPADVFSITCECCKKDGHFTLMCKHLGQHFSGMYL